MVERERERENNCALSLQWRTRSLGQWDELMWDTGRLYSGVPFMTSSPINFSLAWSQQKRLQLKFRLQIFNYCNWDSAIWSDLVKYDTDDLGKFSFVGGHLNTRLSPSAARKDVPSRAVRFPPRENWAYNYLFGKFTNAIESVGRVLSIS